MFLMLQSCWVHVYNDVASLMMQVQRVAYSHPCNIKQASIHTIRYSCPVTSNKP